MPSPGEHVLDTAGHSIFAFMYGQSDHAAAVLRPVLDRSGVLVDVELVMANDTWQSARAHKVSAGALGSDFYSGFELLLPILRRVHVDGRAAQMFDSRGGDDRVRSGVRVQVEWRALPNGMIIETAEDQTLIAEALEVTGPVLITALPASGAAFPSGVIAMNHAFAEMFLRGFEGALPTLGNDSNGSRLTLTDIRTHVRQIYPSHDWDAFDAASFNIYARGRDVIGEPFILDGSAYLRDFIIRDHRRGERIGIWVYRAAGANAIAELPEFAHARLQVIYESVRKLSRPIAAHIPVINTEGTLVDIELVWANDSFNSYRNQPMEPGVLGSQSRVRFDDDFLPYIQRAWIEGEATQYFRFQAADADEHLFHAMYRDASWDQSLEIETIFARTDDGFIMEWGDDIDTKMRLGSDMDAQRRAAIQAVVDSQTEAARRAAHEQFSRDLHDNILQDLFVTGLELSAMEHLEDLTSRTAAVSDIRQHLNHISANIRSLISDSRRVDGEPLPTRIRELVAEWDEATAMNIYFSDESNVDETVIERLPQNVVDNLVVIAKEALSNAVRHSHGSRVDVHLAINTTNVFLSVVDDGHGIDPRNSRSSGTLNLKARAAAIQGHLDITSSGAGVSVVVTVAVQPESI